MDGIRRLRPKPRQNSYVVDTQIVPTTHSYSNLEFLNNINAASQLYHNIFTEQRTQAALIRGTRIASAGSNTTTGVRERVVVLQNEP